MKSGIWVALAVVFALIVIPIFWAISVNNTLIQLDESFNEKKAQLENVYQRRADLIPNLVNTVKGYAKHESSVLEEVTRARAQVGQVRLNTPEDLKKFDQAQNQLSSALSRLMVVAERYPELKANQNFLELQSQIEGTENRITIERQRFNQAAQEFNAYSRQFPQSVVAQMRNFKPKAYFESEPSAKTAPRVEF